MKDEVAIHTSAGQSKSAKSNKENEAVSEIQIKMEIDN